MIQGEQFVALPGKGKMLRGSEGLIGGSEINAARARAYEPMTTLGFQELDFPQHTSQPWNAVEGSSTIVIN